MRAHLKYLSYVLRHKWFVFCAGLSLGVRIWRLVLHDWTKFLPREWFPYVRFFYTGDPSTKTGGSIAKRATPEFELAWNHHQHKNDHHWQFWVRLGDDGSTLVLPMSDQARREMLADWRGAGRALGKPDTAAWYLANRGNMKLHVETRAWIEEQLNIDTLERLATLAHEQWSGWMQYQFSKINRNTDGTWIIPADLATRWQRQMDTPYAELPDDERQSDLVEAKRVLAAVKAATDNRPSNI